MNIVNVNSSPIAYDRRGQGRPLVLLHGYPLDHRIWERTVALLEKDFDLILPDLRGFGGSGTTQAAYSIMDMAEDVAGLLTHLGIQKASLAGHSMGGYVTLAFARLHSDRLLGLGLVATQTLADTPERKAARYAAVEQVREHGVEAIARAMTDALTSDPQLRPSLYGIIASQPKDGLIGALRALAERPDQSSLLTTLDYPVVIIHGKNDALIPVERAMDMQKSNPRAFLKLLDSVGHMPMLEKPDETADTLRLLD